MKSLRTLDTLVQSSGSALLPTLVDTSSGNTFIKNEEPGRKVFLRS